MNVTLGYHDGITVIVCRYLCRCHPLRTQRRRNLVQIGVNYFGFEKFKNSRGNCALDRDGVGTPLRMLLGGYYSLDDAKYPFGGIQHGFDCFNAEPDSVWA